MIEILLVMLLSIGLRVANLLSMPMYVDEATYLGWAVEIWDRRTRAALMIPVVEDGKQPLFMWLAGGASHLFPDPLLAGRLVSVAAGVLSTLGVYLIGRWLLGRREGLAAGLLYAVAPFNLFYDRLALVEGLLNAEAIWVFALSVFIFRRAKRARIAALAGAGMGTAIGMAIWTKTLALLILPFPILCTILLAQRQRARVALTGLAVAGAIGAAIAAALLLAPEAANLWSKAGTFAESPSYFWAYLPSRLAGNLSGYASWLSAYLPTPLWELIVGAAVWGMARRRRIALLLVGTWAAFTVPTLLWSRTVAYSSRYVLEGIFPLLVLLSAFIVRVWEWIGLKLRFRLASDLRRKEGTRLALAVLLALALVGPSLRFDLELMVKPETAPLPPHDHMLYVTGWFSGYGAKDAIDLVKSRALELTASGQPVIVLSNYYWGDVYGGLKMYLRGIPGVHMYVDSHLRWNPEEFIATWKPHHVPILVLGNDGIDNLDQFERAVPQAVRLGYFPKPGGQSSFRVYEVDVGGPDP